MGLRTYPSKTEYVRYVSSNLGQNTALHHQFQPLTSNESVLRALFLSLDFWLNASAT